MMLTGTLFGEDHIYLAVLGWLLTYALHSTLFLAAAWVASRWLKPRLQETVWKSALIGGLLTATLQAVVPWQPGMGGWTLAPAPAGPHAVVIGAALPAPASTGTVDAAAPAGASLPAATEISREPAATSISRAAPWILLAWLIGGLAASWALGWQGWALRRRLRAREDLTAGPARAIVDELCHEIGHARPVRLTTTERIPVPIALGLLRPEICLPRRCLDGLSAAEQRSLLAHELAHLVRRDPAWHLAAAGISALLFFQPLNRLAGRRLRRLSEVLCDDWAVARTGSAKSLARCLTEVAGWVIERPRFFPSPGIAGGVSELGHRIRRLVEGRSDHGALVPRTRLLLVALAAWALVGALAPGWNVGSALEDTPEPAPMPAIISGDEAGDPEPASIAASLPVEIEDETAEPNGAPTSGAAPADSPEDEPREAPRPAPDALPPLPAEPIAASQATTPTPALDEPSDADEETAAEETAAEETAAEETAAEETAAEETAAEETAAEEKAAEEKAAEEPTVEEPTAEEPVEETPPVLETRPVPRFPKMAIRLNKWRASVTLRVKVDETGLVTDVQVVGDEFGFGFEREAIRVARESTFTPGTRDGQPVTSETTLTIHFERRR
ncbi:MAG: M56 family metallopeptidase [bacterium]|nr:M56 family metallopeptidase [bacterium]